LNFFSVDDADLRSMPSLTSNLARDF
jgi:hypothetical protein